jgi:hypothetical protein
MEQRNTILNPNILSPINPSVSVSDVANRQVNSSMATNIDSISLPNRPTSQENNTSMVSHVDSIINTSDSVSVSDVANPQEANPQEANTTGISLSNSDSDVDGQVLRRATSTACKTTGKE